MMLGAFMGGRPGEDDAYSQVVSSQGPWGYWRANEESGTTCVDSSGNGNDGTYANMTLGQPPLVPPGSSISLNGISSRVNFGPNLGTFTGFTVSCVVRFNSVTNQRTLCNKWGTLSSDQNTFLCWFDSSARLVLFTSNTSGTTFTLTSATTFSTGVDYHIALQLDDSAGFSRIFVNGALDNSLAFSGTLKVGTTKEHFAFGAKIVNGTPTDMTAGRWGFYAADRMAFFKRALSTAEISAQYSAM